MMNEKFIKWEPINHISSDLYLLSLHDDSQRLKIQLEIEDSDRILIIEFASYIAYRNTDETSRLESLNKNEILSTRWPLFISESSDYIDWIVTESYGITERKDLKHYVITTGTGIIDIISNQQPVVNWQ
ncbi:hypothetical protein [Solitalea koreensis]|uniref:Uncharacterized protein n=1 Tax=Solitalea koreensis TaxID=543615 RepID=A0A521DI47_9SPHI|nr:hypothetical protein [Solitalea koreensis]SMO71424.1 hypothetical protein SAMN06265350_10720 [Solitalea koreensis]